MRIILQLCTQIILIFIVSFPATLASSIRFFWANEVW